MIRFAEPDDHPRLKLLWGDVFGDSPEAIDRYFSIRHSDDNMLVDVRDNIVTAMLSMIPFSLSTKQGQSFPARYIYAVATDEDYRKQGISTSLMEAAHRHIQTIGSAAAVLVPASANLFSFYQKLNYETLFWIQHSTLRADTLPPIPPYANVSACSPPDYTHIRDLSFQNSSLYGRWLDTDVAYSIQSLGIAGGALKISWASGEGCALFEKQQHGVLIRELALINGSVPEAISVLHQTLHASQYFIRLRQNTLPNLKPTPFGMIRWLIPCPVLSGSPPYLSLAMD